MKARCKTNCGNFPTLMVPLDITQKMYGDYNVIFGNEIAETLGPLCARYSLVIGNIYFVYGCIIYRDMLWYLIESSEIMRPAFYPSELFEVTDASLGIDWTINCWTTYDGILVSIGYDCMTNSYESLRHIISREDKAVRDFYDYKRFIDTI